MFTLPVYSPLQLLYLTELPGCLFELDHCAWKPSDNWRMSKLSPLQFLKKDWQNTLGTYIFPFCFNKANRAFRRKFLKCDILQEDLHICKIVPTRTKNRGAMGH